MQECQKSEKRVLDGTCEKNDLRGQTDKLNSVKERHNFGGTMFRITILLAIILGAFTIIYMEVNEISNTLDRIIASPPSPLVTNIALNHN